MAVSLLTYSGLITKAKAMGGTLLTDKDFEKILGFSNVSEIITFLKEHEGYCEIFKDVSPSIHRKEIEHKLIHSLQLDYAKLYRFSSMKQRKAIQVFFIRFELMIIKICLQSIMKEEETVDLSLFREFFEKHSKLDLNAMMSQDTMEGFLKSLKGTGYFKVLKEVAATSSPTLFDYETRLDSYYYEKLWAMKEKEFSKKEREVYTDIMGRNIDLLNMMTIYRFKKFFRTADTGKLLNCIIPIHYKLSKKKTRELIEAEDMERLQELMLKSPYSKLFQGEITSDTIEKTYRNYLYQVYRSQARKNSVSMIPIEYYLYLKEREIDKLTTALECVRYQLPTEKSLSILEKL